MTTSQRRSAFRFIIALGIVSLLADMTYEGARGIIGPFFQSLGATAAEVGFIAGLGEMLAAGTLKHVIGSRYSLDDIVAAHEAVEHRQVVGNVIIEHYPPQKLAP